MPPEPEPESENALSLEEATEVIAAATGSTVEEIERGGEDLWIEPPEEAEVVDVDSE